MSPDSAITRLVREGACLTPLPGSVPVVVGLMQPLGFGLWFWFAAGGETEFDAHIVDCDRARVWHDGLGVEFQKAGKFAGYLTSIDEQFDDEEERAGAKQVLTAWRARYDTDEALRGFIARELARASDRG